MAEVFNDTCRLCTRRGKEMLPIFNPESLAVKITWVSQLQVDQGDGLPAQICNQCNLAVDSAYQFKELCWTSDEELRRCGSLPLIQRPSLGQPDLDCQILRQSLQRNGTVGDYANVNIKEEFEDVETDQLPEVLETEIVVTTPYEELLDNLTTVKAPRTYSCEMCNFTFKKKVPFMSHMKVHMVDDVNQMIYDDDAYGHTFRDDVPTYACAICQALYKTKQAFLSHVHLHDVNVLEERKDVHVQSNHTCALCETTLKTKQAFIKHVKEWHDPNRNLGSEQRDSVESSVITTGHYSCAICSALFEKKSAFTQHFKLHSTEINGEVADDFDETERLYSCAICDASYKNKTSFISHIRLHTMEKRYGCPYPDCQKRFTSQSDTTRHYRCHTGEKPFRCVVCDKSFSRQDHLAKHGRTHTGHKPFACDLCGVSFSEKKSLASHLRSHRGEKMYRCQPCDKAFARLENYSAHVRTHAGVTPHACKLCHRSFSDRRGLHRHEKSFHTRGNHTGRC